MNFIKAAMLLSALIGVVGCGQSDVPAWSSRPEVLQLPETVRLQIEQYLAKYCGTAGNPKLLGDESVSREHLLHGAKVYGRHCAQCHGANGDGAGRAAEYFDPPPRDFRTGVFKFTSTSNGAKPVRDDLLRTVRSGAKGTAMPTFELFSEDDLQAIVDYVLVLTHRGELEASLLLEARSEDTIDPATVPMYVQRIVDRWAAAPGEIVTPVSKYLPYSAQSVELGKQAFSTEPAGCYKCHGPDGRGREIAGAPGPHGRPMRSADLSSGLLPGGDRPIDNYRRIYAGTNGTPMPSFALPFKDEPATFWHLVHYVQNLADTRRRELADQQAHDARQ